MTTSLEYFKRREALERVMAANAVTPAVRDAHLALAEQYRAIIESGKIPVPREGGSITEHLRATIPPPSSSAAD